MMIFHSLMIRIMVLWMICVPSKSCLLSHELYEPFLNDPDHDPVYDLCPQ